MYKSKIVIASSSRTEILAEKLRDQLDTHYSEADLLRDAISSGTAETNVEMLEGIAEDSDFAVIILDALDVHVSVTGGSLGERDNLLFEAGLFIAALGREHCFVANGTGVSYLPPDLEGIKVLRFAEPDPGKLRDREACADAVRSVGSEILNRVGRAQRGRDRPLSQVTLMAREKKRPAGELEEGHVVVTVTQPLEITYAAACQVRGNMKVGIGYAFYFHGDPDRLTRICRLLQMLLLAPMLEGEQEAEFACRLEKLQRAAIQAQILDDLKFMRDTELLKVYLVARAPALQYVIHNATSETDAILYLKRRDHFIEWERGGPAYQIWQEVRRRFGADDVSQHVFRGTSGFDLKESDFCGALRKEMRNCFPGIDGQVMELIGC